MSQVATKPGTISAYQPRHPSDEAARAGKLQVLLLMGSGVGAAAKIGKAIISIPMIRSDLALGLDLAGLIVATFATLGTTTGIGAGIVLMLLVAPLLPTIGWRSFWLANGLATGSCAILLAIHAPATPATARAGAARFFADALTIVRQPSCLVLAFAFFAYSCQIFSLTFALPLLLTSAYGVSLGAAGLLSAMVLAVSALGHLSSGLLLRAGVPIWANVAPAFGFFAVSGFAVYGNVLPPQGISLVAALALGVGGLAPGAIYAAAPHAAPAPSVVPPTIGLVQQASSLGQFAGPASLGLWVEHFGWQAAPAIQAPAALLGLACAFVLRRILIIDEGRGSTSDSAAS